MLLTERTCYKHVSSWGTAAESDSLRACAWPAGAGEVQEEDSLPDEDDSAAGRWRRWRASSGDGDEDAGGARGGGAPPRAKPLAELQPAWQWLDGIGAEDRSWLHFALFNAYEAQARASVVPRWVLSPSNCKVGWCCTTCAKPHPGQAIQHFADACK